MEFTFFPLLAVDIVGIAQGDPGSVLILLIFVPSRRATVNSTKEGEVKLKGRKVLSFPVLVCNHSGTVQALKGPNSRRQSGAIGVLRRAENRRDQASMQLSHSSPHPQHLCGEKEQISALSDLLLKNPIVRADDPLKGSLTCAGTCPAREGIVKGTHHRFGLLQPSSHTLSSQEGLHITVGDIFIAMGSCHCS